MLLLILAIGRFQEVLEGPSKHTINLPPTTMIFKRCSVGRSNGGEGAEINVLLVWNKRHAQEKRHANHPKKATTSMEYMMSNTTAKGYIHESVEIARSCRCRAHLSDKYSSRD